MKIIEAINKVVYTVRSKMIDLKIVDAKSKKSAKYKKHSS